MDVSCGIENWGGVGGGEKKGDHKESKKFFGMEAFWDVAKKLAKKGESSEGLHCDFYRVRHGKPGFYYGEGLLVTQQQIIL
jgi:hypothetical protein